MYSHFDNSIKVSSIIPFGSYKWQVLDMQGNEALIITEDVIGGCSYNKRCKNVTWKTCDLRKYLNNEFLRKFTKEQQGQIIEKKISNPGNLWYGTNGGSDTSDKIFLLSLEEADIYFGFSLDYLNKRRKAYDNGKWFIANDGIKFSNNYDKDRVAKFRGKECSWWLRSPGFASDYAANVSDFGSVHVFGYNVDFFTSDDGGVRPALWLKV